MQIDSHIRKSVAFLEYIDKSGEPKMAGTAFLVTYPTAGLGNRTASPPPKMNKVYVRDQHRPNYLVTAGHVIRGIHNTSRDRKVIIKVNKLGFGGTTDDAVPTSQWHSLLSLEGNLNPDDQAKDVAILRFDEASLPGTTWHPELDLFDVPMEAGAYEDRRFDTNMDVGDDVIVTGLFPQHSGKRNNIPVVRTGTIAAMPEELIKTEIGLIDGYMVEVHSQGGLSGSPAFFHLHGLRKMGPLSASPTGKAYVQPEMYLLGPMGGHWDLAPSSVRREAWEKTHSGMAIVVPVETIVEALDMPEIEKERNEEAADGSTQVN